jgi:hypothetical protein
VATTADQLITAVLRKCFWDTSDQPLTNAEILAIADEVILGDVWPTVVTSAGDYYVSARDYTLESGKSRYRLPSSLFGPVRDVLLVDSAGTEISIPQIDLEDLGRTGALPIPRQYRGAFFHFFDGDFIGLYPTPSASDTTYSLRVRYYRSPNKLVVSASATTVSSIDTTLDDDAFVVVANAGSWSAGAELDVISAGNAHQAIGDALELSVVAGTTFTFTETLDGVGIQAGDYVAATGYSPIVQAPDFMIPFLVTLVASECMEASGDMEAASRLSARAFIQGGKASPITRPRSVAEPQIVRCRNSPWGR